MAAPNQRIIYIERVSEKARTDFFKIGHEQLNKAASDLGANKLTIFFRIVIPMLMPGILSGAQLAFTLSLDDVVISYFTSGPGSNTLPLHIFSMIKTGVTPDVNALISLMLLVIFITLTITTLINIRKMKGEIVR